MKNTEWLDKALVEVKSLFTEHGYEVPEVRVTLGFTSKGLRSSTVGECWPRKASTSNINHIFISPANTSSAAIISTMIHECIHAIDDCEHAHSKEFKEIAIRLGFKVPMRSTPAGVELAAKIDRIVNKIGEYEGSTIKAVHQPKLQRPSARAKCLKCGYKITMIREFLKQGPPICPEHGLVMERIGNWDED